MVVGPLVKKFTWLLDDVEIKGIVRDIDPVQNGTQSDSFAIEPDENYRHLISSMRGNNPLPWHSFSSSMAQFPPRMAGPFPGCMHCETKLEEGGGLTTDPNVINRLEPWPLGTKPGTKEFEAIDPSTNQPQPLKIGDHIRVLGRWVIDHHPEYCLLPETEKWTPPEPQRCRSRGWLQIGPVHAELHPIEWNNITLVKELKPNEVQTETLSLAAPLHEEVYTGGWKWAGNDLAGVASKIFITDDGSNYHNTVTANAYIQAPPLPTGFTPHASLIQHSEEILRNGTGLDYKQVRSKTVVNDGIRVTAKVVAPATQRYGSILIADVEDPARNRSVFQARYTVQWKPRLIAVDSRGLAGDQLDTLQLAPQATGGSYPFLLYLANRGPDPLEITKIEVNDDPDSNFQVDSAITFPLPVPQMSVLTLKATFSPKKAGRITAKLLIHNNDPVQEVLFVGLTSAGIGDLARVQVSPLSLDFGPVQVGTFESRPITIHNIGNVNASVSEMTTNLASAFEPPFVNQPQVLPPDQSQIIDIFYVPTQRGAAQGIAKLFIQGSSPVSQEIAIALKGQGIAPILVLDPPIMDFGAILPGTTRTLPLRIRNDGDASLTINNLLLILSVGKAFSLDPAQVFPFSVVPTSSMTLQITYSAGTTPGQTSNDEWEVVSDDPTNPHLRLSLRGIVSGPRIDVLPDFIDFHHLQQVPALVGITVRNDGSNDLVVDRMKFENGTNFSLVGVPPTPVTIAAGSQLVFQVQFQALKTGIYYDRLIVYSNDARRGRVSNTIEAILE
jgi:hypothetical protein